MQASIEKGGSLPKVEAKFINYVKNCFRMSDQEANQDLWQFHYTLTLRPVEGNGVETYFHQLEAKPGTEKDDGAGTRGFTLSTLQVDISLFAMVLLSTEKKKSYVKACPEELGKLSPQRKEKTKEQCNRQKKGNLAASQALPGLLICECSRDQQDNSFTTDNEKLDKNTTMENSLESTDAIQHSNYPVLPLTMQRHSQKLDERNR
ncbi:hypothetical protein A6R68_05919, partial [Neotoma lepida]